MQTPKARAISLEVPQKTSPATPRTAHKLKGPGSDSDAASPHPASKTPKGKRVVERRSPRSLAAEKKRPNRVSELESQLVQLQEELKKTKDQLSSSESLKRRSQFEAEEARKQLAAISAKLEESEQQLLELSASEDSRVQELRKISQDRDRAWQSELEAVQKQHSMDSTALTSSMNEIQKLRIHLERVAESEATHARHAESAHAELQSLRLELAETLTLVEKLRSELSECKESESLAQEVINQTQIQLEIAKTAEETLRAECLKATEDCESLTMELEQSKSHINTLEKLIRQLQTDVADNNSSNIVCKDGENEEAEQLKSEPDTAKLEVGQLRSTLEAAERRYQEEYIQNTLQIRSAYELVERAKSESSQREADFAETLKFSKSEIEDMEAKLVDKETKLISLSEENEELKLKVMKNQSMERETELETGLEKLEADLANLQTQLLEKETEMQGIVEENEVLKSEIRERELESNKAKDQALALAEAARAAEREALTRLAYLTEEADESGRKAARITEQLDAAQATNSEMESEFRKLKVQSDQWRKAAEAAAAMLSTGNNGKIVERTGSLDNNYHTIGGKLGSPLSEDMDDDSPKKKNGNVLKKIGILLKKGQK